MREDQLAPPALNVSTAGPDARAASISRSASRDASKLFIGREAARTGLLDEVDGVPLALDRACLFLSGCRNSNLDGISTSALLAHPARALDHHIGRIAVDIEPANLVEIQGSDFTGRVAKAFSVRAP